ncbi:hypothetical protein, variant 1 [Aphanomyces astaci]|uniref:Uncharacterized protein n=1 Tax=Aphanomyces astaci TaxID=112090 RepID=W4FAW9_APHAT|nr:hypothetical protein, variant 1 [Aphanomyces astaci]ETV64640.1 hypothetical protein, variant 1 [Aphanomyces astaci]|eukprot:XP_009845873.1 hypothetical protein, variant 1 [Aphanomyces astaci]
MLSGLRERFQFSTNMNVVQVCIDDGSAATASPASVNTNAIKLRLQSEMSLHNDGESRWKTYWTSLQQYVQSEMPHSTFQSTIRTLLHPSLLALHNELILAILHNAHLPHTTPPPSPTLHAPPTIDVALLTSPEPNRAHLKRPLTDEEAVHTLLQLIASDDTASDNAVDDVDDAAAFLKSFSKPPLHTPSKQSKPATATPWPYSSGMPLLRPKLDPSMWSRQPDHLHLLSTHPLHHFSNNQSERSAPQTMSHHPTTVNVETSAAKDYTGCQSMVENTRLSWQLRLKKAKSSSKATGWSYL